MELLMLMSSSYDPSCDYYEYSIKSSMQSVFKGKSL